jgi:protein O-mannosyl-transferase
MPLAANDSCPVEPAAHVSQPSKSLPYSKLNVGKFTERLPARFRFLLRGILLVAAILAAYQPAWHAGYIWDDDVYVTQDELLTAPDGLWRIWFSLDSPSQYFPLVYTTFRIEYGFWGLNPAGYHWVNILLHSVNALLVWWLLARLKVPGAWLAAAIFALHPVQVESVAWITERKNVLMGCFFFLSLLAWVAFVDEQTKRPWRFYALSLVTYVLALFSKTTACTLPVVLLLILWLEKKPITRARMAQVVPFFVFGLAMGLVTIWWERCHQNTHGALFALGPIERVLVASRALWFYLGKLAWPSNLTFSYPRWVISSLNPLAYTWLAATAGLGVSVYLMRRRLGRGIGVALIFFTATLCPMLGFIMLYTFRYSFVADHYQYIAALGPVALAAAGFAILPLDVWKKSLFLKPAFCGLVLLSLGVLTWRQCGIYTNDETLNRATIMRNPASWMAHNNLGSDLLEQGKPDEAIAHFKIAHTLNPKDPDFVSNIGDALLHKGRIDEAITQYREAIRIGREKASPHYNLGTALLQKGQTEEAIIQFQQALELQPRYADAHNNLGLALVKRNDLDDAIIHFEKAVEIQPGHVNARNNLGSAFYKRGQLAEAIAQYQKALEVRPDYAEAQSNVGHALARKGSIHEAIAHFEKAVEIRPADVKTQTALAAALMQQGHAEEAISHY